MSTLLVPSELTELVLRRNKLASISPSIVDLAHYSRLKRLDLSHNSALRSVPQELVTLTALEHLDLSDCGSLTELPADMSDWRRLSTLLLARTPRLATLPASLASLPALTAFSLTHLSAAAPRALGVRAAHSSSAAAAATESDADDYDGCVPSRHCVGALSDADAMRARYQYHTALRLLGSAPHPLAGAMLLALATADGKRFLHNDGIAHMRAFVDRPHGAAAARETPEFRAVAADFVARTLALLAHNEEHLERLTQKDALQLMLRLARVSHKGVAAEVCVSLLLSFVIAKCKGLQVFDMHSFRTQWHLSVDRRTNRS